MAKMKKKTKAKRLPPLEFVKNATMKNNSQRVDEAAVQRRIKSASKRIRATLRAVAA